MKDDFLTYILCSAIAIILAIASFQYLNDHVKFILDKTSSTIINAGK